MQRLKTRSQFQAVLSGETVSRTAHFALHRVALDLRSTDANSNPGPRSEGPVALFVVDDVWLGVLIPKRWARRAVTRNAIRRQIYAQGACHESHLPHAAHVVRLRAAFDVRRFPSARSEALRQAVRGELEQLFARVARPAVAALTESAA